MTFFSRIMMMGVASFVMSTGCTPKVYIIDRPTLLEAEAAGEWPELEEAVELRSLSLKPQPLAASEKKVEQKKPYRIIAGEFQLSKADQTKKSAEKESSEDGESK